jgi:hypothetical protein
LNIVKPHSIFFALDALCRRKMRRPSTRIYQNQLIIQLPRRHCNSFEALPPRALKTKNSRSIFGGALYINLSPLTTGGAVI